jgi:hypothetical protein
VYAAQHDHAMPMRSLMVPERSFLPDAGVAMSVLCGLPLSGRA